MTSDALIKLDRWMKGAAAGLALTAGSTFVTSMPAWVAILCGAAAALLTYFAGSPLFDPSLVGKTPLLNRVLLTIAGLTGAGGLSTFIPAVAGWLGPHAHQIGAGAELVTALAALYAQSPVIGGGTSGAGGARMIAVLFLALGIGSSGCAAVMSNLPQVIAEVQDAELVIGTIQRIMDAVFITHPDPKGQALVDGAINKVIEAARLVNHSAQGIQDLNGAQTDDAFKNFEAAWNDLMSVLGPYGITSSGAVARATPTANGGAVVPRPLLLARAARK